MSDIAFWDKDERPILLLLTPEWFDFLPDGTVLYSINGDRQVKGKYYFDKDTRGGFMAWGIHLEHDRNADGSFR